MRLQPRRSVPGNTLHAVPPGQRAVGGLRALGARSRISIAHNQGVSLALLVAEGIVDVALEVSVRLRAQ